MCAQISGSILRASSAVYFDRICEQTEQEATSKWKEARGKLITRSSAPQTQVQWAKPMASPGKHQSWSRRNKLWAQFPQFFSHFPPRFRSSYSSAPSLGVLSAKVYVSLLGQLDSQEVWRMFHHDRHWMFIWWPCSFIISFLWKKPSIWNRFKQVAGERQGPIALEKKRKRSKMGGKKDGKEGRWDGRDGRWGRKNRKGVRWKGEKKQRKSGCVIKKKKRV